MHEPQRPLQFLLDGLEEAVFLLDSQGLVTLANAAAYVLVESTAKAVIGRPVQEVLGCPVLADHIAMVAMNSAETVQSQAWFTTNEGKVVPVKFGLVRFAHEDVTDPAFLGAAFILRFRREVDPPNCDIADRDNEIKLSVVLNTIVDAVIVSDERGHVQLVNASAEDLFGYSRGELIGRNINMLMPAPVKEAHDGYLRHYLETGEKKIIGVGREVVARRKDGSLVTVYLSIGDAKLNGQRLFVGVLHDLTARKINEARVMTLSAAMEQNPSAIMIIDVEGRLEYVNSGFTSLTGYSPDQVQGKPFVFNRIDPDCCMPLLQPLLAKAQSQGGQQEEVQGRRKDGVVYWALQSISPLRDSGGVITHFLVTQLDITQSKQDKQALQESEERFQQVADMTGEWLWEQDPGGHYIYSSSAVEGILGYSPDQIMGRSYLDLMTEDDRVLWSGQSVQTTGYRRFHRLINRYRHRDGHEVYTESTGAPLLDDNGNLVKWRGVDSDVTARKQYEDALRLRDRAIEAASVGIDITDARRDSNANIYVNRALTRITGYTREELMGQNMALLQGPETDPKAVKAIGDALRTGSSCEVIIKNYRKDGTAFWNDLLISPVHDEAGNLTHFIGVQSDVTELRRASEERHELEIAKQIQLSLLPKGPLQALGVQAVGMCLPAAHVGGDYFDYFASDDCLDIVIADVSGHSVGAALIMAEARSALKAETRNTNGAREQHGPAHIVHTLNEVLHEDLYGSDLFISLFYLRYHAADRRITFANAGHNPPLILPVSAESCRHLDAEGMILGVKKGVTFAEESEQLNSGDRLLFYTDGATESQNKEGEFFGVGRLCALLAATRAQPPQEALAAILDSLHAFSGDVTFADDVSLVILDVGFDT